MALPLLPTSLVGSYAQPDWLIDRKKLAGRFPPRVRAKELWRVAPEYLEQAQDDATLIAIREQERAGLDIITDGEQRRESYSNRFATALEGVDIDNPGTALDRSGHPNPVPRVTGKIRRKHPVEVRDLQFLRANTDRAIKITVPGPFTMSQQAQNDFYKDEQEMVLDYAAAVNAEIKDLFKAGADIVQIDEPYMQARPDKARQIGLKGLAAALDGVKGTTAIHICFGYAAIIHVRPEGYSFLPELGRLGRAAGLDRNRAIQARLHGAGEAAGQDHHPRCARPVGHGDRNAGDGRRAHPPRAAACAGREDRGGAGLRAQIPAARGGLRQDESHGRGREDRARRAREVTAVAKLFPTTLVGSYPQPDWLIDRARLSKMVPRVRMDDLWLPDPKELEAKQDEATLLAIRDQERAGLDIISDGEQRRESYSNRFATALEGVDRENPGSTLNRSRQADPGAARHGQDQAQISGRSSRRAFPARQHEIAREDDGARPLHHVEAGAERVLHQRRRDGARLRRRGQ